MRGLLDTLQDRASRLGMAMSRFHVERNGLKVGEELRRACLSGLIAFIIAAASSVFPAGTASADSPVSLDLSGWGWCLAYKDVSNATLDLDGIMTPREDAPDIADVYLTGTLNFNLSDRTDSFDLELRGTKVRSLFFLKQVSGGEQPLIAEIEGTWLADNATNYVACEGRLAVPAPNHVAKPYIFVLRTADSDVPSRVPGNWVQNLEFIIGKSTLAFDRMADTLAQAGDDIKELVGTVLTEIAVLFREVRRQGTPYFI